MQTVLSERNLDRLTVVAHAFLRYGLALVIGWIGYDKFFVYEAEAIQPLVATSPFMGWLYHLFSVTTFSDLLGVLEVSTAVLLCTRRVSPLLSALGAAIAVVLFVSTISFLFTAPDVLAQTSSPVPNLAPQGSFLVKDFVLMGASLWALADSLRAMASRSAAAAPASG